MKIFPIRRPVTTTVDRFQIVGELNETMEKAIKELAPAICSLESHAPIRIAQNKGLLLCNSGIYTSSLHVNKGTTAEEIQEMIQDNVYKNKELRALKKSRLFNLSFLWKK